MRVKTLDLLGFKSFATKTTVQFEPGVTAIVGPNGSGKSNIVDAIRWVLGEHNPRDVRAPRLEDVIFNGTDQKAPLSMAEVSLTIENERGLLPIAFSEVQVTRRVYRSGESEYLINQSPCRLRDIQELFLGTGLGGGTYAIIEQGHIDMILSSKPEERRVVFEEASGIARYLTKKQETLRRLDDVEQDLTRVADIAQEVKRQLSALERQAAKARQYKTQWEQLKGWEVRLASDELRQGEGLSQALQQRVAELTREGQARETERQELLASMERCHAVVASTQSTLQDLRTRLVETASQIEQHRSQLALKTRWIEELAQQRAQLAGDAAQLEEQLRQLAQQQERLAAQQASWDAQHADATAQRTQWLQAVEQLQRQSAEGLAALDQLKLSLFELAAAASHARNTQAGVAQKSQQVELQVAKLQDQQRGLQERSGALNQRQQQLEQERQALAQQQETLSAQAGVARQAAAEAQTQRDDGLARLHQAREGALHQRTRVELLEGLWRRHEGFPDAVKTLLEQPPVGVVGLLADLLEPQAGFERALDAALGPLAAALVVEDRAALGRCRQALASRGLDGVSVVVLSDAKMGSAGAAPSGSIGWLSQFVRCEPPHRALMDWLIGSWAAVERLDALWAATPPSGTWVSTDGEIWNGRSWQLTNRAVGTPTRLGRKQQWEQARQRLDALDADVASAQQALEQAEARWQSLHAQAQEAHQRVDAMATSLTKVDAQAGVLSHDAKRTQDELSSVTLDLQELTAQQRTLTDELAHAHREVAESERRQQDADASMKTLQAAHEQWTARMHEQRAQISQCEASLKVLQERQAEVRARVAEIAAQVTQVQEQRTAKQAQDQQVTAKITELSAQVEEHRRQADALGQQQTAAQAQADQVAQQLQEQERSRDAVMPRLLSVEQQAASLTQQLKTQEAQVAERAFRRERITERLREIYHLDEAALLDTAGSAASPLSEEERQQLTEQIERLKIKLETVGPVNLGSVEEYDALTKRLEFLQTQQQDLVKSRDDLKQSIVQINRTARQQFRETFTKIQQEFQHYFIRLFNGGHAELVLLDEDDVLESGIEIIARPPGKRPQSISLLSGGERALTAIALLFALFKVRPSPFCILDEIDAPLDEANVDRFTKALEEFLSLSQFILITHNKKTITKADCLYGVTMEQPGVSKIVSVKLTTSSRESPQPQAPAPEAQPVAA